MEWQHYSPWDESEKGGLIGVKTPYCVTPGLSFAYPLHHTRDDLNISSKHHQLHYQLQPCQSDLKGPCLKRVFSPLKHPMALRARTITSAGMGKLVMPSVGDTPTSNTGGTRLSKSLQASHWKNLQQSMWNEMPTLFGVHENEVMRMRHSLESDLLQIVADAMDGQCSHGHSCKDSAKIALQALSNKTTSTSGA